MNSGWTGANRLRVDQGGKIGQGPHARIDTAVRDDLAEAIQRTTGFLLSQQHPDGHWVAELEGDSILESEYALLLVFLGRESCDEVKQAAGEIRSRQSPDGGWAIYPGGPLEISASVKSYWVLKIAGDDPDAEHMKKARKAILASGGAERVNSFTRYYFALLGQIGYHQCPAVPPELMLIPRWCPFNIYEMSAWSRTILVPLSVLWAYQPVRQLPESLRIDELFLNGPASLPVTMESDSSADEIRQVRGFQWKRFFCHVDRGIKLLEKLHLRPLRKLAVRRAHCWIMERFADSDGLGAIFPPIIWSVVALRCLGYTEDSEAVTSALNELERLSIVEDGKRRLQPCKSPVWDTAITTIALREAGVAWDSPAIRKSVAWLLEQEVKQPGDWAIRNPGKDAGGWFFEYRNAFYPDVDDTTMVVMALQNCLPHDDQGRPWSTNLLFDDWSPHEADRDATAVVSNRRESSYVALRDIEEMSPSLAAIRRGVRWILNMQNRDGGWAAFDVNNDRELFTQVPFADHNAMIDPSTADITARVLEMLGHVNVPLQYMSAQSAVNYLTEQQESDGSWIGRWGVNYIYGTWQTLVGLTKLGVPKDDPRIQAGAHWLMKIQQSNGGWGESPASYEDPTLRGQGNTTASQTAWALMGLMAAGQTNSNAVRHGINYLKRQQCPDGSWNEPEYTGTGFPRVFYLRYHLYRIYFPLMALARYQSLADHLR